MNVKINDKEIATELLQVPTMNYGQLHRWENFVTLRYSIEMTIKSFIEKTSQFFNEFRDSEIKEDDTDDFPELLAFKNAGWPQLDELVQLHTSVLKGLIIYHQYEILHLLIELPKKSSPYCYSANSIDEVLFNKDRIVLNGICFKSDYVEHTYNYEQSKKQALLK